MGLSPDAGENVVLGVTMEYGIFMMPSHPPEREVFQAHQWDLDCLVLADKLGFSEAWIGEHYTALWEPVPSPDLMIAQALMLPKNSAARMRTIRFSSRSSFLALGTSALAASPCTAAVMQPQ